MEMRATVRLIRKGMVLKDVVSLAVCQTTGNETYNLRVGADTPADLREGETVNIVWRGRWTVERIVGIDAAVLAAAGYLPNGDCESLAYFKPIGAFDTYVGEENGKVAAYIFARDGEEAAEYFDDVNEAITFIAKYVQRVEGM